MNDPGFAAAFRRMMMAREAAASVSLSHPEGCDCVVCRAAGGDEAAMAEVHEVLGDEA